MKIDLEITVSGLAFLQNGSLPDRNSGIEQCTLKFNQEISAQEFIALMEGYAAVLQRFLS